MAGAIIIVVLLVVVMPIGVVTSGAAGAGLLGWLLGRDRDLDNLGDDGQPNEYLQMSEANPWE